MHRKIGILGGMSPESTVVYYESITREYVARFGDFGYPEILIYSVSFQQFVDWQRQGRWDEAAAAMASALRSLHRAGADFGLISTNTMHIVFDQVQAQVEMPLLSIVDTTACAVRAAGTAKAGLLGTLFTMREPFFREKLERLGVEPLVPPPPVQHQMNGIIFDELCRGEIRPASRAFFKSAIEDLCRRGAQGIILGCTEIPLLVKQDDFAVPLFDTTALHARAALEYALAG
jgi:aspartate racemase